MAGAAEVLYLLFLVLKAINFIDIGEFTATGRRPVSHILRSNTHQVELVVQLLFTLPRFWFGHNLDNFKHFWIRCNVGCLCPLVANLTKFGRLIWICLELILNALMAESVAARA